ncbi:glycoside hydrolase/deacetylase [Mycena floridula]|nr:glycoside hydrolase/deacetylase [Mycena floridula]
MSKNLKLYQQTKITRPSFVFLPSSRLRPFPLGLPFHILSSTMLVALLLIPLVSAGHLHARDHHDHVARKALPETWYHERSHPVHDLMNAARGHLNGLGDFSKRADAQTFPAVGSPEWLASLPPFSANGAVTPDTTKLPQAWVDAFNAATIPDIPQTSSPDVGTPVYPNGLDPLSPTICSSYAKCRADGDHWDVPTGTLAINFDDGPTESTPKLLSFLAQNNEIATHFMIGYSILQNPTEFNATLASGGDLAVHTWSHAQLTTKSNIEVVSELGWSMFIIYQSTNGRVPKYWRPPTGDADNRIRAIAKQVFGLEIVLWNQDTEDWSLTLPAPFTTPALIASNMTQWLTGPKTPGLMILEHELSDQSVDAFIAAYPQMKSQGWNTESAARLLSSSAYRNADGPSGSVTPAGLLDFKGAAASGGGSVVGATGSAVGATGTGASGSGTKATGATKTSGTSGVPSATSSGAAGKLSIGVWGAVGAALAVGVAL